MRGVAEGTVGSFVGRNNDVLGYWGIGMLCRLARDRRAPSVEIDLLTGQMDPPSSVFVAMVDQSRHRLRHHLDRLGLGDVPLASASLRVRFETTDRAHAANVRFRCTAVLEDEAGRVFESRAEGWCWPHDPRRESRSTRVEIEGDETLRPGGRGPRS